MKKNNNKKKKTMSTATIAGKRVKIVNGRVSMPVREYERLLFEIQKANAPVEYLSPKAAARLDREVRQALADYKAGKTKKLSSFSSLRDLR